MIHLTLQQLSAFLDGELTDASTELIRRHLSECDACTLRFGRIEAQEEVMARILVDEPGEEFFAELGKSIAMASVGGKSAAATRTATAPPRAPSPEARPTLSGRREQEPTPDEPGSKRARNTWIVAVVLCVIVMSAAWVGFHRGDGSPTAGPRSDSVRPNAPEEPAITDTPLPTAIAPIEAAPTPAPTVESPMAAGGELAPESAPPVELEKAPQQAPVAEPEKVHERVAKPRTAARANPSSEGSLRLVIPGRPDVPITPKSPAPAPERLVDRPVQNVVPVRTIITETIVAPADQATGPPPPAATPLAQAEVSTTRLVQEARSASLRAAKSKDPAAFDGAASAWERAMPALQGSPEDLAMARRELAQARFQAWAVSPSEARREAAVTAARAYLLYAPPGPERDQAWTWLGRLKR